MLVEALELLVGGRADADHRAAGRRARRGSRAASWSATTRSCCRAWCRPTAGRAPTSTAGPSTVGALADAAAGLVDLHGQHAHQSLLAGRHASAPRSTASARRPRRRCGRARARLTEIDAELAALGGDERERAREIDLLRFQVAELDAAGARRPGRGRRAWRRARTCSPTPSATARPAPPRTTRSPTTAARATPSPRRSSRSPAGRRSAPLADRLAAAAGRARRRRRRAPRHRRGHRRGPRAARGGPRSGASCCATCAASTATTSPRCIAYQRRGARRGSPSSRATTARAAVLDAERGGGGRRPSRRPPRPSARPAAGRAADLAAAVTARLRELAMPHADVGVDVDDGDPPATTSSSCSRPTRARRRSRSTKVASGGELARTMLALRLVLTAARRRAAHAGVRRGRRRHRRHRGDRGRPRARRGRPPPPGARRHPPRPGRGRWPRRRSPSSSRVARRGDDGARRRSSTATSGSPSWPACCRATTAATPPGATPSSCWRAGAGGDHRAPAPSEDVEPGQDEAPPGR